MYTNYNKRNAIKEVQKYLTEEDVEKIMDPHTYIGSIPTIIDELLEESESWF